MNERSRLEQAAALIAAVQQLSFARSLGEIQRIVSAAARHLTDADGATVVLRDGVHRADADGDGAPLVRTGGHATVSIRRDEPLGAIRGYWSHPQMPTPEALELLQALADSTAVAIENVRFYEELEEARRETLQRLALAAEYRDDDTYEHTSRVARTSFLIAERLGVAPRDAALISQAAPLHDLGKLAVPDAILLKPGRLTPAEREHIRRHPSAGAAILAGSKSEVLRLAEEIALTHHEWWDGSGYPAGLAGRSIPLGGRIVALADVFDALTHVRPYKRAWSVGRACTKLVELRGTQFDPAVVDAFAELDASTLIDLPAEWSNGPVARCRC